MIKNQSNSSIKVLRYEEFLNNVLREDLRKIVNERNKVTNDLSELSQLETMLEKFIEDTGICTTSSMTTKVDLGCNFYVTAKIPKSEFICVNIGFGFYAELTFSEALNFVQKKIKLLEDRLQLLTKNSSIVKARIKIVLEGLREIQGINEEPDERYVIDF